MTVSPTNLPVPGRPSSVVAPERGAGEVARLDDQGKTWGGILVRWFTRGYLSSVISSDFMIEGNVTCNGHARLDGVVLGNVACKDLVVGANGSIMGDVDAETIVVYGKVTGTIYCRTAKLERGARVSGDIYHEDLTVKPGGHFAGRSIRHPADEENVVQQEPTADQ